MTNNNNLLNSDFAPDYNLVFPLVAGSMYRGISSSNLVIQMAKAGYLSFLGTGGMSLSEIEDNLIYIRSKLKPDQSFGANLLCNIVNPEKEFKEVLLLNRLGINILEAAAFMDITIALVYYRIKGLTKNHNNQVISNNKIIAKLSRPEVASKFLSPPPIELVNKLKSMGYINTFEASQSQLIPMADDICVEADSGGHTDAGRPFILLPSIVRMRNHYQSIHNYTKKIRVGAAGGIGSPESMAASAALGAEFFTTGSINQCTVEAGTSDLVKDILQEVSVNDTAYAPAGDMFEVGARVQVVSKKTLFPFRANHLYDCYKRFRGIEDIPTHIINSLENYYFRKPISEVWEERVKRLKDTNREQELVEANNNPKYKMALLFRNYFFYSSKFAFEGNIDETANLQIHCGPAMGVFNQIISTKYPELKSWRNRHVSEISALLINEFHLYMNNYFNNISNKLSNPTSLLSTH